VYYSGVGREISRQEKEGATMSKLRCAVYARYSSDKQSASSITDQVRKCREHAHAKGWEILADHIYSDEAISGATAERAGLKRLLAAAESKARPFDVILVDDSSRLSRNQADSFKIKDRMFFAGVRIGYVSQGYDSDSKQSDLLMGVHAITDALYISELSEKTRRGLEGKVLNHMHHGGRCFGYKSMPIEDPKRRDQYGRPAIAGARLQVDPEQAKAIRTIFTLYASGLSLKATTKKMNADKIASPTPRAGREHSWSPSSIRGILANERYRGVLTWAKTKKVRNPKTGKKVQRISEKSIRVEMPEQRIVSEKLWLAVQERLAYVKRVWASQVRKGPEGEVLKGFMNVSAASSPYIFSGLLRCGLCGHNFTLVSGTGSRRRTSRYGCPFYESRGTCKNSRLVGRDVLEKELLAKLQRDVLSDAAINYVLGRVGAEIEKRFAALDGEMDGMQRRKTKLESELQNLGQAFATGFDSPTIRTEIAKREAELSSITEKTLSRNKDSVHAQVSGLRKFVEHNLRHIRRLISGKYGSPDAVRQELAKHIESITLSPEGGEIRYKGEWKLLGDTSGAEGQNRTGYAGLFRAALYQ
jgi:site-specific DNA recombinase